MGTFYIVISVHVGYRLLLSSIILYSDNDRKRFINVHFLLNFPIRIALCPSAVSVCHSTLCPKNRTRILWSITFTNIDQYQCHLTELFVQQYLIIYHKKYSHSRVPPATVTMATSTTRADQRLWYYSSPAHRVPATVEYLRHATPDFISPDVWPPNSPDLSDRLQNLGLSSRPMFIRSARATSTS